MTKIVIAPTFCGPTNSGNGGYVCGLLASFADFDAAVMLRQPPPLAKPLSIKKTEQKVSLLDGELLIGEAFPEVLDLAVPPAPDYDEAGEAAGRFIAYEGHVFPDCFVCGPNRSVGDGLRIFAGKTNSGDGVAAPWLPSKELAGADGTVAAAYLWAALDCPGYFSINDEMNPCVLGKMTAKILQSVRPGERCVVTGWPIRHDGRKHHCGTAIFREDGSLAALAKAIWIDL